MLKCGEVTRSIVIKLSHGSLLDAQNEKESKNRRRLTKKWSVCVHACGIDIQKRMVKILAPKRAGKPNDADTRLCSPLLTASLLVLVTVLDNELVD